MSGLRIAPLPALDDAEFRRLIAGYESDARYRLDWTDGPDGTTFTLRMEALAEPLIRRADHLDVATLDRYRALTAEGICLGGWLAGRLVALALAEAQAWNGSLWVWEFHVEARARRRGVGAGLMVALEERARAAGLRVIVCETQTTNMPAIRFYRRQGFRLEGVDLSTYSNTDWPDGEIAVFMKKRLDFATPDARQHP